MKERPDRTAGPRLWAGLRLAGVILSAAPIVLMLVTGLAGSIASGRLLLDAFLPAELFFLTFPGMVLMAVAAGKQRVYARLSAALPVAAAAALLLGQGLALVSGIASGLREAGGAFTAALMGLLLFFDLTAAAAPVVGIVSIRRLRRMTP